MKLKSVIISAIAMLGVAFPTTAQADEEPYQPTEAERVLANQTITDGNYRIYTEVRGTKYYLYNSNGSVQLTSDKSNASEFTFEYTTRLAKFKNEAWKVSNNGYRFSNGPQLNNSTSTALNMSSNNDRPDFERQVWFAKEDAQHAGEYVYAVRATNATNSNELAWQSWSSNCYWTVNTDATPYPCYDVANAGKGSFVWKLEPTKEVYKPIAVYDINDITAEEFANNPVKEGLWRFEKYSYGTGKYSLFTQFSDSTAANFIDVYQPCRAGGELVVDISNYQGGEVNNIFASTLRNGWSDYRVYNNGGTSVNSKDRFCYVVRDEKFGYEVYANDEYASVISFVIPKDGFYQMDASVLRQDVPAGRGLLSIVPRYRYSGSADMDYASSKFGMCRMLFGQEGEELPSYGGNAHINNGAEQRYSAQKPTDMSMAFEGKAGDIISFEVNTDSTHIVSNWARDFYGRTFYQSLKISQVEEAYARQNENFADTYGEGGDIELLNQMIVEYEDFVAEAEIGDGFGQYNAALANQLIELIGIVYDAVANGDVHAFNCQAYVEQLQDLWRKFIESKKDDVDYDAEGNYALFLTDPITGEVKSNTDAIESNGDTPWGYYYYEVGNGTYHKFANHDTSSKFGNAEVNAWYKGTGDWLYIADNGFCHPMTNLAPAIMFTAPADGVYKVDFSCFRPDPNVKVENPLWVRARFMEKDAETQDKDVFMFAKEYGSVANDGQDGKAPISMEYYVNMKQGDKITWEIDCYTTNRNSSAGTQITHLSVCTGIDADNKYSLESIPEEADLFDSYSVGDPTALENAIAEAMAVLDSCKGNIGTEGGQYSPDIYDELDQLITDAAEIANNGDTQYNMDQMAIKLANTAQALMASRMPYEFFIEGTYAINIADTEKYLTQKNKNASGSNYYAAFTDYAGVAADATKNNVEPTDFSWTFTFKKITKQVPTGEYDETTGDDITVPVEQTSIYGNNGYVTTLGYVEESSNEAAAPAFRFFKKEVDDEVFAIMNENGDYWTGSFVWQSPYDKANVSKTPSYIFMLSDMTLEKATGVKAETAAAAVVGTQYYTVSGTKVSAPQKGINIRVQKLSDGRTVTSKIMFM